MTSPVGSTSSFRKKLRRRTKDWFRDVGKFSCLACGRQSPRYNVCVERPISTISRTPTGWFILGDRETAPIMHPCNDILDSARDKPRGLCRSRPIPSQASSKTNSVFSSSSSLVKPSIVMTPNDGLANGTRLTSSPVMLNGANPVLLPLDISSVLYNESPKMLARRISSRLSSTTSPPPYSQVIRYESSRDKPQYTEREMHGYSPRKPSISKSSPRRPLRRLENAPTFLNKYNYLDVSLCNTAPENDSRIIVEHYKRNGPRRPRSSSSKYSEFNPESLYYGEAKTISNGPPPYFNNNVHRGAIITHTDNRKHPARVDQRIATDNRSHNESARTSLNQTCPRLENIGLDPRIPRIGFHGIHDVAEPEPSPSSERLDLLSDIRYIHLSPREMVESQMDKTLLSSRQLRTNSYDKTGRQSSSPRGNQTVPVKKDFVPRSRRMDGSRYSEVDSDHNHVLKTCYDRNDCVGGADENLEVESIQKPDIETNLRHSNQYTEQDYSTINPTFINDWNTEGGGSLDRRSGMGEFSRSEISKNVISNGRTCNDHSNSTTSAYSSGFGSSSGADRGRFLSLSSILVGRQLSNDESESSVFSLESPPLPNYNKDSKTKLDSLRNVDGMINLMSEYRKTFPCKSEFIGEPKLSKEERCERLKCEFQIYKRRNSFQHTF